MLEEAAGTRMYEMKRQGTLKTIEKKDAKLTEFREVCVFLFEYMKLNQKNIFTLSDRG